MSHFSFLIRQQIQCKVEFDKERRQFFICDVGSRNGTFLNGVRLSEVHLLSVLVLLVKMSYGLINCTVQVLQLH